MLTLYLDADACPVKDEAYRVAGRYSMKVIVVANSTMRVPASELIALEVRSGYGEVDDWIAEQIGPRDIVITADIPLAARCLEKGALALGPQGNPFNENSIGDALAIREIREYQRQEGTRTGGPAPLNTKDRSRFLAQLDEMINKVRRNS